MYLEVAPNGGKWWRLKYRFEGKEKRLSLDIYPEVSLKDARAGRDEARKLLAAGVDPSAHRQASKAAKVSDNANTLEVVAREWFAKHSTTWAKTHSVKIIARLENDIFPWLDETIQVCADKCPHLGKSLQGGTIRNGVITRPRHGAKLNMGAGALPSYSVKEEEGGVFVLLPG